MTTLSRITGLELRADQDGQAPPQEESEEEPEEEGERTKVAPDEGAAAQTVSPETSEELPSFPADIDEELATGFVGESLDLLQEIEVNILELEKDPSDPEVINAIFRPFHTIKGVSGFLNLAQINKFAHQVENLLDEARSGNIVLEGPLVDLVLDAVDLLRLMITDLSTFLQSQTQPQEGYALEAFFQRIKICHEAAVAAKAGDPAKLGEIMIAQGSAKPEEVEQGLAAQEANQKPLGTIMVESKVASPKSVARGLRDQRTATPGVQSIKVDTTKLDNMVDAVGELVIALSLVSENPKFAGIRDQKLERDMGQLGRITSELQKTAMSLRMVPIKQTFQRMSRVVRDLSQKSGKPAQLIMEGADTEIDRTMVDSIYDPMVHMVRNSMDHGLEDKEDRKKASKPEEGMVALRAYHQGGKIVIEIEDDGKGLDPEKILAKARERGLVGPEANLSDNEIYQLILQAGFSTADQITDISGRGVGMDVVREAVEGLRGNLEISSKLGQGSKFTIRLPLTMAIIEGMIVSVAKERYIIPALSVAEVLKPEPEAYHTTSGGKGEMVMVRGRLLPLVRLDRLFGSDGGSQDKERIIVVVESEDKSKAIQVDELLGKQEVVIKSLGGALGHLKGLSGGAILGDGRVGLILDVAGLFYIAEHGDLEPVAAMPNVEAGDSAASDNEPETGAEPETESEAEAGPENGTEA
jgi:two-component system chemotaxis sensor kinase CheA